MKPRIAVIVLAAATLFGCASSLMKPATTQSLSATPAQSSRVIFLRPSSFGGAIQASLFDVSGGAAKFIGVSSTGTKVVYDVAPGTHRFMVVSEAADFMEASLAPGKTYYGIVTARMGAWKARFSLWPVKADAKSEFSSQSKDFAQWAAKGKIVENTPEGQKWFDANRGSIQSKHDEYLVVWKQRPAAEIAERTLNESDGLDK